MSRASRAAASAAVAVLLVSVLAVAAFRHQRRAREGQLVVGPPVSRPAVLFDASPPLASMRDKGSDAESSRCEEPGTGCGTSPANPEEAEELEEAGARASRIEHDASRVPPGSAA